MTSKKFRFEYAILERPLVLVLALILCSDVGFLNHSSTRSQDSLAPIQIEYSEIDGTPYYEDAVLEDADDYQKAQCRLQIVYPSNSSEPFATLVWFHGGGLTGGQKYIPSAFKRLQAFKDGKLAIVAVGYRLSPKVPFPVFIEDAAASTAWVLRHIADYGGDPNKVFVSGGSAGGYLTAMIGTYPKWLNAFGASRGQLAGLIPVSGQMTTHFHVKELLREPLEIADQHQIFEFRRHFFEKS